MTLQLTETQLRKLARIQNRSTLYEAVVTAPDGRKALLAYCGRHSKVGLRQALVQRSEAVLRFLGAGLAAELTWKRGSTAIAITGGGSIDFSGRTQRDAIIEGELTYVADAKVEG